MGVYIEETIAQIVRQIIREEIRKALTPRVLQPITLEMPATQECEVCGWLPPPVPWAQGVLHVHHVIPKKRGGTDEPTNLVRLCANHHAMAHRALMTIRWSGGVKTYFGPVDRVDLLSKLRALEDAPERFMEEHREYMQQLAAAKPEDA